MNKKYLRVSKTRQQSVEADENLMIQSDRLGSNFGQNDDSRRWQSRSDSRGIASIQNKSNQPTTPTTQEQLESLKNMKKIWKKAVFSIKKDAKPKVQPPLAYPDDTANEIPQSPRESSSKKPSDAPIDPIYLMLRSAACYKPSDETAPESGYKDEYIRNDKIETTEPYNPRDTVILSLQPNVSETKLLPKEDQRRIKESVSASRINQQMSHSPIATINSSQQQQQKTFRRRLEHQKRSQSIDNPTEADSLDTYNTMYTASPVSNVTPQHHLHHNQSSNYSYNTKYSGCDVDAYGNDIVVPTNELNVIGQHNKYLSNSYSNTHAIDSQNSSQTMRKKYMHEQHRSISMEHDPYTGDSHVYSRHNPVTQSSSSSGIGGAGGGAPDLNSSYRSTSSITSPRQSNRYSNAYSDDSKRSSQASCSSSVTRTTLRNPQTRANWKMKSFSVDIPDNDPETSGSQYFHKASSHTSSPIKERPYVNQRIHHSDSSAAADGSQSSLHAVMSAAPSKRSSKQGLAETSRHYPQKQFHHVNSSGRLDADTLFDVNSQTENRRTSNSIYIAIQDFYGRRSDELDFKAGSRIELLKCSDPDWWTGRCNGRVGYFPSSCVQRMSHGDSVWRIVRDICLDDDDGSFYKLKKGEVVVQHGYQDGDLIPICIKKISYLWCPIDYVGKLFDDYI